MPETLWSPAKPTVSSLPGAPGAEKMAGTNDRQLIYTELLRRVKEGIAGQLFTKCQWASNARPSADTFG
jgi:hypothetical protein